MSDKTEAPTPSRLSDARSRGQVAKSHELNSAAALLVGGWLIFGLGQQLVSGIVTITRDAMTHFPEKDITFETLKQMAYADVGAIIFPLGEIILGLMVLGVVATFAQTGFLWADKRPVFDFGRVNPINGFKRLFSSASLFELLKSLLKLVLIGWVVYNYLKNNIQQFLTLVQMDFASAVNIWLSLAKGLIFNVGGAYLVLAAADYAYQRWQYMRSLKMTKQEVLEDFKRTEGDPFMRGRIRQQQRRMARMRMMSNVPKADVIVTNPTHFAVAIMYNSKEMKAPKVLAKGAYQVAQKIVDVAKDKKIPVVQNIPLARALYHTVDIDQEVPPELYVAMAEVLAYVYRIRGKAIQTA